jgi:hypothetical protein
LVRKPANRKPMISYTTLRGTRGYDWPCMHDSLCYCRMALFVNIGILDFYLSWSPMLTHLFRHFDCFRLIGMRPRGWRVDSSNSAAVTQLSQVHFFVAWCWLLSCHDTVLK